MESYHRAVGMIEDLMFKKYITREEINNNTIKLLTKDEVCF